MAGLRNRLSVCTTFTFLAIFVAIAAVPQFLEDRELYLQELDSAFYTTIPYWLTYLIIEAQFTTVVTTVQLLIIWAMGGFPWSAFGPTYPMMYLMFWLATSISQAWSAWCKTLMQAYTALWAAGMIFYAFSGAQAPLGVVSPALRWMADVNYWRWCLQYVVSRFGRACVWSSLIAVFSSDPLSFEDLASHERLHHGLPDDRQRELYPSRRDWIRERFK